MRAVPVDLVPFVHSALQPFLGDGPVHEVEVDAAGASPARVVLARHRLQNIADYRDALRQWFGAVAVGGRLIVTVPHAFLHDRQLVLPSPWSRAQRRLYTPASLAMEVEEALTPNSYRVRWLGDLDEGYDYDLPPEAPPAGDASLGIVIERIAPPAWPIEREREAIPTDYVRPPAAFEPPRTRVEVAVGAAVRRVLILKLDHLGDFIMALPALERARATFADARITLVVGAWNVAMARDLGLADEVIAFDAFPRNSTEEEADVRATLGLFRAIVTGDYDLAIDLRSDVDTRILLQAVSASIKAGLGTRSRFPWLDIALPLDLTRNDIERAEQRRINADRFVAQGSARRGPFSIRSDRATVERDCAIVWGPFDELEPGDYIFDFYLDLDERRGGIIALDVAVDGGRSIAQMTVSGPGNYHLPFRIEASRTRFEARIWAVPGHESLDFSFFGGLLFKKGAGDVLHQSEYQSLLIELVRIRLAERGLLAEAARA